MKYALPITLIALTLTACGDEPLSSSIIDNNQIISKQNATANAKSYALESFAGKTATVRMMSDSTIGKGGQCRFGDGWASGSITVEDTKIELKCQTNGSGKGINGCMTKEEFTTKDYAKQDGRCDTNITSLDKLGI